MRVHPHRMDVAMQTVQGHLAVKINLVVPMDPHLRASAQIFLRLLVGSPLLATRITAEAVG